MSSGVPHLSRHLTWLVLIKVVALAALWWLFVRGNQVTVDDQIVGQAMGFTPQPSASMPRGTPR